jgi:hypothetical protein
MVKGYHAHARKTKVAAQAGLTITISQRFTVLEVLHDIALKAGNIGKTKKIIS